MKYKQIQGKKFEKQWIKENLKKQKAKMDFLPDDDETSVANSHASTTNEDEFFGKFDFDENHQQSLLERQSRVITVLKDEKRKNIDQIGNIYKNVVEMQLRGQKTSNVMNQQSKIFHTYLENIHKKYRPAKPQDGDGNISGYDSEQDRIEYEKLELLLK